MTAVSNKIRQRRTPGEWVLDIVKVIFLTIVVIVTCLSRVR